MLKNAPLKHTIDPVTSTRIAPNGALEVAGANPGRLSTRARL